MYAGDSRETGRDMRVSGQRSGIGASSSVASSNGDLLHFRLVCRCKENALPGDARSVA